METRVVFTGKSAVTVETFELPALKPGQALIRNLRSLLSIGTETIVLHRRFDPGTHWDRWVKYPFYPGYAAVGEVVRVGEGVTNLKPGMRVAHRGSHASAAVVAATSCFVVPEGIEAEDAAWFALAKIAAMGARASEQRLGDSVAVIGAGPVGQMALRWALAAGANPAFLVDTVPFRLELGRRAGDIQAIAKPAGEALDDLKAATGGEFADIVIDSTGHAAVFPHALAAARKFGRVVLLGDTGRPAEQHLTSDVITRGVHIVGAHDCHEDAAWNSAKIVSLFFRLLQSGRFSVNGLVTHRFRPADAPEAYRTADERRAETMGVVFEWAD